MASSTFHIAIDGPVAAGKGTVSKLAAQRLGFLYVDTGAMYRMAAYLAHQHRVDYADEAALVKLIEQSTMDMRNPNESEHDSRLITALLDDEDVSWKIRTEEMGQGGSKVSALPKVREVLVERQKKIAEGKDVIMEGRDITYRVLPNANLKIFLTADLHKRAERRLLQLQQKGLDVTLEQVVADIEKRDQRDMGRANDPLKIVDDAWVIDTSELTIEQVVDLIVAKVQEMQA